METFSAGQAARLAKLSYDMLDYWSTSGFITPSARAATGKGSMRSYNFRDIVALRVTGELRDAGISLQALRKVVARLREMDFDHPLAEARLALVGGDVAVLKSDAELLSLVKRPGQAYLTALVNLGAVVDELRRAIAA